MDAPVEHMDLEPYVRIARTFGRCGMNVPEILEIDYRHGFAIITDFGNRNYLDILDDNCANDMYEDALNALVRLQAASLTQLNLLTPYDAELLQTEMNLFHQWYLPKQIGTQQIAEIYPLLNETYEMLIAKALEQPKVWVHLDYHSRNLMYVKQNNPGIIDFQDAVTGPVTYDLVSLLKDCYIRWPQPRVEHWIEQYLKKTAAAGIPIQCDTGQFMEWFDWMGLQRHLKVAGIFTRLNDRDNKADFLRDLPRVFAYIESVCKKYSHFNELNKLLGKLKTQ